MGWQEGYRIRLCQTFLKFRDPILCDMQAKILNQDGLHEMISSLRLLRRGLPEVSRLHDPCQGYRSF